MHSIIKKRRAGRLSDTDDFGVLALFHFHGSNHKLMDIRMLVALTKCGFYCTVLILGMYSIACDLSKPSLYTVSCRTAPDRWQHRQLHPSLLEAMRPLLFFWKEVICLLAILYNVPIFPRYKDCYIPFLDLNDLSLLVDGGRWWPYYINLAAMMYSGIEIDISLMYLCIYVFMYLCILFEEHLTRIRFWFDWLCN